MNAPPTYLRVGTGLVVLAVVAVVFLLDKPGGEADSPTPEASTPSSTQASTPTAPPSPVTAEDFCVAFNALAAAQVNHLAENSDASRADLEDAAAFLLQLAPGAVMPPKALQGLEELVKGTIGELTTATDEEAADALTAYLAVACPATY